MKALVQICRENNVISKVIFENCYLEDGEIIELCRIANKYKPDYIKTSTGFGTSGATVKDVQLMRKHALPEIGIKAAGGYSRSGHSQQNAGSRSDPHRLQFQRADYGGKTAGTVSTKPEDGIAILPCLVLCQIAHDFCAVHLGYTRVFNQFLIVVLGNPPDGRQQNHPARTIFHQCANCRLVIQS